MKNIKRYIRKNSTLSEVIIMLLGIVLVTCSRDSTILTGIGASVIASAIVVFMTDVFIGNEENENVKRWGLEQVYCTRGGMNSSCDEYLLKAKRIDIIAFGLKSFRDTQQKQIERILDSGGKPAAFMGHDRENFLPAEIQFFKLGEYGIRISSPPAGAGNNDVVVLIDRIQSL